MAPPGSPGAGLRESESGCLADELDGDDLGPSRCDAARPNERGVFRALRKVFQSFSDDNAFLERLRHRVDEHTVGMAVLVHLTFTDDTELANGVATLRVSGESAVATIVSQPGRLLGHQSRRRRPARGRRGLRVRRQPHSHAPAERRAPAAGDDRAGAARRIRGAHPAARHGRPRLRGLPRRNRFHHRIRVQEDHRRGPGREAGAPHPRAGRRRHAAGPHPQPGRAPPEPGGAVAGYTAPLDRWVETAVGGVGGPSLTLRGYFSQTYRPEHHNFSESFVFDPHLEEGIDPAVVAAWDARGIRALVLPAYHQPPLQVLTTDGRIAPLPAAP